MCALHDARVAKPTVGWVDGQTIELRVEAAFSFAWPQTHARPRPGLVERVANWLYKLATPDLNRTWLDNFSYLGHRLSRGAQPGREGFRTLAELGVNTVINLRQEAPDQEALVRSLGMDYLYYPLDPLAAPTHQHTLAFLHTVCDPARGHVFFHCYHGADRTGVLAACYRIAHDNWALDRVVAELDDHNFHRAFQQPKLSYLENFQAYWLGLSQAQRDRVLHRA
jgi:protein tyrosine/serine phosphatase